MPHHERVDTANDTARGFRPDASTFGARLALLRQHQGWGNVKEAALACGLPSQSWRNWERDGRLPRDYMAVCQQIAEYSGVDLDWLIGGDELRHTHALTSADGAAKIRCTPPRANDSARERARRSWGEVEVVAGPETSSSAA